VWAYHRFCLSFRDVEELLAERGIIVSYETIRQWCEKFGLDYARRLKRREGRLGDHWPLDEVFIQINGQTAVFVARRGSGRRRDRHFWSSRIVISAPQSDFFENSCVARVPNHCRSLPTN
jgi:hypothetical protein